MEYCTPQPTRRHNPVDSICRKLQTIQWRGDREPNSPFQIPKLSSSSYDSPQCGLRQNLEAILKKGNLRPDRDDWEKDTPRGMGMPSSAASQKSTSSGVPCTPSTPALKPSTPTAANVTYTITSTLGDRRGPDGRHLRHVNTWQRYCSTPSSHSSESPYFTFTRGPQSEPKPENETPSRGPPQSGLFTPGPFTPGHNTHSYNLNFCSVDNVDAAEYELSYPALVVKRLSMTDGGTTLTTENRRENMAEISLICEENLLDTIFHACDTQRRGKVYVSHIVDYLRNTTSRDSEDRGLEELCNMLDPDHKDVSIDLDTYHAVMREWIDDCRNNEDETVEEETQEDSVKFTHGLSAKRSMLLNMTSGSLEAFGGEASRAEFETSELVYCVADLQMSNQKLQEEVRKLKQVVESMEDSNQRLAEDNEELQNRARLNLQLAQKEKMLKDEVEEMKATLSCTEENRARASAHTKHVEKENQTLIAKISSLQEENFKVTMEMDELQRRITELCDINADLQVQMNSFDSIIHEKEAAILEKSRQINELKVTVEEYSSITELLRADKNKLENQIQMMHPDLLSAGLSLSVVYRLNQSSSGSLQTELALAQSPLETPHGVNHVTMPMSFASPLDETLDREVLLLLQGPSPQHTTLDCKTILHQMKRNLREEAESVLLTVGGLLDVPTQPGDDTHTRLKTVQSELDARRVEWVLILDQLGQYTDSLEKELITMSSNMRRSRTEILHLTVRVQEQENQKRQLREELEQLRTPQDSREASCQTPTLDEEPGEDLDWDEEFALQDFLKNEISEKYCRVKEGRVNDKCEETAVKITDRGKEDGEKWMVLDPAGEVKSFPPEWMEAPPGKSVENQGSQESDACAESEPQLTFDPVQEEASEEVSAHSAAVSSTHPEADPSHSNLHSVRVLQEHGLSPWHEQDQDMSPPPPAAQMVPHGSPSSGPDETSSLLPASNNRRDDRAKDADEVETYAADMKRSKSVTLEQRADADASATDDSTSLLPILVEEEESVQDAPSSTETQLFSSSSAPPSTHTSQSGSSADAVTSDPNQSEDVAPTAKTDFAPFHGQNKKELEVSRSVDAMEERKNQEQESPSSTATDREPDTSLICDTSSTDRNDRNSISPNDKEIEAEFQRLALGFKCDMFTLEKRLRLEERSRDLAEENVRREVSSCQGLLQALTPLCEDDNQSMEIIQRLQKNLDILIQSMSRVSSRSEMLGAIHQESRIGKAVEVMIQHVENLRRTYTKEHAELLELRETLMQNERSFGSSTTDDFRGKKTSSQYYKSSTRRVSIATIPRSGGNLHFDMAKAQDASETESERVTRRSPWNVAGKNMARPPLKRFVSSAAWVDSEEPSVMMKGDVSETPAFVYNRTSCNSGESWEGEHQEEEAAAERRRSSLSELGNILTSLILPNKTPSLTSSPTTPHPGVAQSLSHGLTSSRAAAAAVARSGRGLWLWLAMLLLLAGLLALLATLVMQPAVDAAPVGTGDSWMTIQQLLWPYTGLRHNGQPPV